MQDQYTFLNGVLTEFKDGGLQLREDPNPPATDSVLILGTAVDGPILEPVAVDARSVYELFGKATTAGVPNGSTVVQAFEEAYKNGGRDIRVMRVSGTKATGQVANEVEVRSYEAVVDDLLGLKSGNAQATIVLDDTPTIGTVSAYANGVQIPASKVTTTIATKTVTIAADVCDVGAALSVKYTYDNVGVATEVTKSAGVATGTAQTFDLAETPKAGTTAVFIDGVPATSGPTTWTVAGTVVTVKPEAGRMNAKLEVSYAYIVNETHTPVVKIESVFGGIVYNQTLVSVEAIKNGTGAVIGKKLVIKKPAVKLTSYGEGALEYTSLNHPTFGQLAQAINEDPNNNVVKLFVALDDEFKSTSGLLEQFATALVGGSDGLGLSRLDKFNKLQDAYLLLENYTVDSIVVTGANADEEVPGQKHDMAFAYQLALACAVISNRGHRVTGYIQTSSPSEPGLAAVEAHTQKLEGKSMSFNMRDRYGNVIADAEGNTIDLGAYLIVFAGPDVVINTTSRGTYAVNSAASLAGFVSTLDPEQAPTNKVLKNVLGLRFTYGMPQANRLVRKRYCILKGKRPAENPNAIVVAIEDAPTASAATSDWARLSTVRAVKVCVDDVKDAADPFIGQPNSLDKRNAFAAAMAKKLDARKQRGTIADYAFRIIFTQADLIMGQIKVELDIVPQFELRKITQVVGLTPSL